MATHSSANSSLPSQPAPTGAAPVLFLLRFEGLAAAALSSAYYARTGASWWLFAALWIAPDLSMLGYLAGPCRGARVYNAVHSYVLPAVLGLSAFLLRAHALLPVALIWINHIGVDRLMGYGLKYTNGFGWTHLGTLGTGRGKAMPAN